MLPEVWRKYFFKSKQILNYPKKAENSKEVKTALKQMIQSTAVKTSQNVNIREITCFLICGTFHFCLWNLHLLHDPEESDRPHCGHFVLQEAVVYSHPRRQIQIKILI